MRVSSSLPEARRTATAGVICDITCSIKIGNLIECRCVNMDCKNNYAEVESCAVDQDQKHTKLLSAANMYQ